MTNLNLEIIINDNGIVTKKKPNLVYVLVSSWSRLFVQYINPTHRKCVSCIVIYLPCSFELILWE
jgi:hypothetical protein